MIIESKLIVLKKKTNEIAILLRSFIACSLDDFAALSHWTLRGGCS